MQPNLAIVGAWTACHSRCIEYKALHFWIPLSRNMTTLSVRPGIFHLSKTAMEVEHARQHAHASLHDSRSIGMKWPASTWLFEIGWGHFAAGIRDTHFAQTSEHDSVKLRNSNYKIWTSSHIDHYTRSDGFHSVASQKNSTQTLPSELPIYRSIKSWGPCV